MADETLWAVEVGGSNDLLAMPCREDADWWAFCYGQVDAATEGHPMMPKLAPKVVPWPYSQEAHAANIERQRADAEALQ